MAKTGARGVTVVAARVAGGPYQLSFHHPLLGKRRKPSVKTRDGAEALRLAKILSGIISNPSQWRALPDGTPEIIKEIWGSPVITDAVERIQFRKVIPTPKNKRLEDEPPHAPWVTAEQAAEIKANWERLQESNKTIDSDALKLIQTQQQELKQLKELLAVTQGELVQAKAMLRKLAGEAAAELAPRKTMEQALSDYFSDDLRLTGTSASKRTKQARKSWVKRLALSLPSGLETSVSDVKPEQVINHIADAIACKIPGQKKSLGLGTARKFVLILCKFLTHETKGLFRSRPVIEWSKKHLIPERRKTPYWLDQKQVDQMLEKMPQYWREAALVQWVSGCRPEELATIQREKVLINGDIRIEICDLLNAEGKRIWKPKTRRSYGKIHCLEQARETLTRLKAERTGLMLFPDDFNLHNESRSNHRDPFQKANQIWTGKTFCHFYRKALRAAAAEVGLEASRIDSRTLRRSAGKRVLIASGFDINKAAALLRDLPETTRSHYADVLPEDVTQPS